MSGNLIFAVIIFMLVAGLFIRSLVYTVFKVDKRKLDEEREKELLNNTLSKEQQEKEDIEKTRKMIESITAPFVDAVSDKATSQKIYDLERKLKFCEADKYFTPYTFLTLQWVLRIAGVLIAVLLYGTLSFLSLIIGALMIIGPGFLLNNTYTNKQDELTRGFPEMINIISGYLSADMLFTEAVRYSLPHMDEHWKPIMEKFIIKANMSSVEEALDWLKYAVDIAPIKEFVSIVKLNLELGNSVKDSFAEQADKVRSMLEIINDKKITKRKSMATMVQAPLLLCIILAFALPTIGSLIDLFK